MADLLLLAEIAAISLGARVLLGLGSWLIARAEAVNIDNRLARRELADEQKVGFRG